MSAIGDIPPVLQCPIASTDETENFNNDYAVAAFNNSMEEMAEDNSSSVPFNESLRLLTTSALPSYIPPPPPNQALADSLETYSCSICGDTFYLKSSLNYHMKRRSVLIQFSCDACASAQVFYNRCSLLMHIQSHVENGGVSDITKAVVLPLPQALMEDLMTNFVQNMKVEKGESSSLSNEDREVSELLDTAVSESNFMTSFLSSDASSEKALTKTIECSECNRQFANRHEREEHFNNGGKLPPVLMSQCQKCDVVCPSECSLKAHKRLHLQISPYICPECGDNPDRFWENFQRHVKYDCFHLARTVCHKCSICDHLCSSSSNQFKKHLILNHLQVLYKCHVCPMAFVNLNNYYFHSKKSHIPADGNSPEKPPQPTQLYKCGVCQNIFNSKEECDKHWDKHLKERNNQFAFQCMSCGKLDSKSQLKLHIRATHPELFKKYFFRLSNTLYPIAVNKPKQLEDDAEVFGTGRFECLLCHTSFTTRQGHSLHVTKTHGSQKSTCGICSRFCINRMSLITHGKEHLRQQMSLCLLCQNKQIVPPDNLDDHLVSHVKKIKFKALCPFCDNVMLNSTEALQHLRLEHCLNSTSGQQMSNAAKREKQAPESVIPWSAQKRSSNSSSETDLAKRVQLAVTAHPVREGESICAICEFASKSREEFKKHILSHKKKKTSHQCQSCGLCFVVVPSLKKHLLIAHRIADVDQYISLEGTNYAPENETNTTPESPKSNSLDCSVCHRTFESDFQLKTHMRSHGMAYIRAKKNLNN